MSEEEEKTASLPPIRIKLVKPGDGVKSTRRPSGSEFRGDMSQFYVLKHAFEEIFDHTVYLKLKESGSLKVWRKHTSRLLDAIEFSSKVTVQIVDDEWRSELSEIIARGKAQIARATNPEDLFAVLSATLMRVVFQQIGFVPTRSGRNSLVPLSEAFWAFTSFRSVQYVQSPKQKADQKEYLACLAARRSNAPLEKRRVAPE